MAVEDSSFERTQRFRAELLHIASKHDGLDLSRLQGIEDRRIERTGFGVGLQLKCNQAIPLARARASAFEPELLLTTNDGSATSRPCAHASMIACKLLPSCEVKNATFGRANRNLIARRDTSSNRLVRTANPRAPVSEALSANSGKRPYANLSAHLAIQLAPSARQD